MADKDEIIMIDQIPFYMRQPTERLQEIYDHYSKLLQDTLGDELMAFHRVGSAAIPGMPGAASLDIVLQMKNFPPTDEQVAVLQSINFEPRGKAPHTYDDIMFYNTGNKFDSNEPIRLHQLGQVVLHFLQHTNTWVKSAVAFVEYLKSNKEAFKRYRDVKVKGAELQKGKSSDNAMEVFVQYKMHKNQTAKDLLEEAKKWAYEDGNFIFPNHS